MGRKGAGEGVIILGMGRPEDVVGVLTQNAESGQGAFGGRTEPQCGERDLWGGWGR